MDFGTKHFGFDLKNKNKDVQSVVKSTSIEKKYNISLLCHGT